MLKVLQFSTAILKKLSNSILNQASKVPVSIDSSKKVIGKLPLLKYIPTPWYLRFLPIFLVGWDLSALVLGAFCTLICFLLILPNEIIAFVSVLVGAYGYAQIMMAGSLVFHIPEPISSWKSTIIYYLHPIHLFKAMYNFCLSGVTHLYAFVKAWNMFLYSLIVGSIGIFGTIFLMKFVSLVSVINATAIAWVGNDAALPIWFGTIVTSIFYHMVLEPGFRLFDNPSLVNIALVLLPDPLAMWNFFINMNIFPFRLFLQVVTMSQSGTLSSLRLIAWVWNDLILQDLTILPWVRNLHQVPGALDLVTLNPDTIFQQIARMFFNPVMNNTTHLISQISSLRGIWR